MVHVLHRDVDRSAGRSAVASGNGSQLLEQRESVYHCPLLSDLSLFHAIDADSLHYDALAGGSNAQILAAMGPVTRPTHHQLVPFLTSWTLSISGAVGPETERAIRKPSSRAGI